MPRVAVRAINNKLAIPGEMCNATDLAAFEMNSGFGTLPQPKIQTRP